MYIIWDLHAGVCVERMGAAEFSSAIIGVSMHWQCTYITTHLFFRHLSEYLTVKEHDFKYAHGFGFGLSYIYSTYTVTSGLYVCMCASPTLSA